MPCTSKMPLATVAAAPFVRSLCLRCGVECVVLARALCVSVGPRSASVPCASGLCMIGRRGCVVLGLGEPSVWRDGVGVDPAATVSRLWEWCLL